jgi:exopolysaccharide production protein ExoQ
MAQVAFPLCLLFIILALRHDIKEYPRFSKSLWVPFLWLCMTSSRPFSFWLYPSRYHDRAAIADINDYIQGSPTERAILIGFICVAIIILSKRRRQFSVHFRENGWLILLFFYALISIGWSDYSGIALRRYIRATGDIIMALIILTEDNHREAIEHVLRRSAIILLPLSVLFVKYYSNLGIFYVMDGGRSWVGVTLGKNQLGILCAFLGVFLVWRIFRIFPKLNVYDTLLFVSIIYLLSGAKSATSNVVFITGVLLYAGINIFKNNPSRMNSVINIFIILTIFLQLFLIGFQNSSISDLFFSATGRDASFTGRTSLWSALITIGSQSPLVGAGYSSFWLGHIDSLAQQFAFRPTQAHNGYLEVFLNLGIIGLILLIIVLLQTYKRLTNSLGETEPMGKLLFIFLLMIMLHNVTEASIMVPNYFLSFLLLLVSIVVIKIDVVPPVQG